MVPEKGLEPPRCYPPDFESGASAIPPLRQAVLYSLARNLLYHKNSHRQVLFLDFKKYYDDPSEFPSLPTYDIRLRYTLFQVLFS